MKEQLWVLDILRPELVFPDIPGICFCGDSDSSSNDSSSDDSGQPDDGEEESTTSDEEIQNLIESTGYQFDNDNDGDNDNNNTPAEGTLNSDGTLIWSGGSWKTAYYDKLGDVFASQAERDESNALIEEIEDEVRLIGETDDQGRIWGKDDNGIKSWHMLDSDEGNQALLDADPNILDIPKGTVAYDNVGGSIGKVWDGNNWVSLADSKSADLVSEIEVDGEILKWRGDKKGWMSDEQSKAYDDRPNGLIHPRYDSLAWDKSTGTWKKYYKDVGGGVHFSQLDAMNASYGITRKGGLEVWTGITWESIYTDAGAKAAGVPRGETLAGIDGTEKTGVVFDGEKWVDVNSLQGASVLEQLSDGSKWRDDGINMGWYTDEEWDDFTLEDDANQLSSGDDPILDDLPPDVPSDDPDPLLDAELPSEGDTDGTVVDDGSTETDPGGDPELEDPPVIDPPETDPGDDPDPPEIDPGDGSDPLLEDPPETDPGGDPELEDPPETDPGGDPELEDDEDPPTVPGGPSDGPKDPGLTGPEPDPGSPPDTDPGGDPALDDDLPSEGDLDGVVDDTDDTGETDPGGDPELDYGDDPDTDPGGDPALDDELPSEGDLDDVVDDTDDTKDTDPGGDPELDGGETDDDDPPDVDDDDDDNNNNEDDTPPPLNYDDQLAALDTAFADLLSDETFSKVEDDYLASFSDEMQTEYDAALRGIYDSFKRAGRITSSELAGEVGELDDQKSADLAKLGGDADTFAEGRRTKAKTRKSNLTKALMGLTTQADIDNFTFDVFGDDDYGTLAENPDFGDAPEFFKFFDKASPEEFRLNITRPYRRTGTYQPKTGSTNYSTSNRDTSGRGSSRIV